MSFETITIAAVDYDVTSVVGSRVIRTNIGGPNGNLNETSKRIFEIAQTEGTKGKPSRTLVKISANVESTNTLGYAPVSFHLVMTRGPGISSTDWSNELSGSGAMLDHLLKFLAASVDDVVETSSDACDVGEGSLL
jgi:hypothetical protein